MSYIYDETIIKEPTCTESGEKTLSCSCGRTTTETIPALGHDYRGEITKPATETEDGVRTFTCTRCGDSYTELIEKTGGESKPDDNQAARPIIRRATRQMIIQAALPQAATVLHRTAEIHLPITAARPPAKVEHLQTATHQAAAREKITRSREWRQEFRLWQ